MEYRDYELADYELYDYDDTGYDDVEYRPARRRIRPARILHSPVRRRRRRMIRPNRDVTSRSVNPRQQFPEGSEVQTILFDREYFKLTSAKSWLKKHDFKYGKVDKTENYLRFRQQLPSKFMQGTFRTIEFDEGIKAIVAWPKEVFRKKRAAARKKSSRKKTRKNTGKSTNKNAPEDHYEEFHGVDPDRVHQKSVWVPGNLTLMGAGIDVGYGIKESRSKKDGWYVHDFKKGVRIYRRARRGEKHDKSYKRFPMNLMVLGYALGFTYEDEKGRRKEVKGGKNKTLAVTPDKKMLVVIGVRGVEYVMLGGNMRVTDWIRD